MMGSKKRRLGKLWEPHVPLAAVKEDLFFNRFRAWLYWAYWQYLNISAGQKTCDILKSWILCKIELLLSCLTPTTCLAFFNIPERTSSIKIL